MPTPQDIAIYIISFIVLIGVMVVVHEFGHFAVAKLFKVRVESFSVGFGPRLFGIKRGDTDYKVCLLPLGGYVKMTGESPTDPDQHGDDPGAFTSHPRWQRVLIGLAGPVANFILAFVLMVGYYYWINEVPKHEATQTTIEWVAPGSTAAQDGLQTGDVISRFGPVENPDWTQVVNRSALNVNQTLPVTVIRDGKSINLSLHIPQVPKGHEFDITDSGIWPQTNLGAIGVDNVSSGTPAQRAGLRDGDQIEKVDGLEFHDVFTLLAYMRAGQGKPLTLTVRRNGVPLTLVATPAMLEGGWKLGFTPTGPTRHDPLPFGQAVGHAKAFCRDNSFLIVEVLRGLFTHKVAVSQLSGPIGIARMAGQAFKMPGYLPKFGLAAAISINLGILNLLPFPILDGGLILLLIIESVLRQDISINVKERIYQAAFVLLVVFFAFVMFNDVTKLPIFNHVKP
jgi:regulator of sigma E protease